MTRLAILSDIHGNLPALEAVIADMAPFAVDQVIVAGDVINWGPFSAAVVARVTASGWATIRGNNEYYLLDYNTERQPAAWRDFELLPWLHRQLGGHWQNVIASWPDTISLRYPDAPPVRVIHGSPRSNTESIFPELPDDEVRTILDGVEESVVIAGHTHLAMDRTVGDWRILNPGSVGGPVDGEFGASYMLLEARDGDWHATFRRIEYDDAPVFEEFERLRFTEECGITAHLIIEEFKTARLQVYPFMRWRAAEHAEQPLTMALVERFTDEDRWAHTPPAYHPEAQTIAPAPV